MVWEALAERVRRYPEEFARCVSSIIQRYEGKVTVILFGSRAAGRHSASSDYDIMVVVPSYADYFDEAAQIRRLCRGVPVDVVLFTKDEFVLDGIVAKMLESCVTIHDGLSLSPCQQAVAVSPQ
ncbi:nucleotidyltransferase domain-containing protein [Pyrobaculum sp.]|uniref:nucleotidyltransferase domain-containing protein n=1 Tax=Pyrobaculum sp. TaxID=2004705 RepID=UPI00318195F2